MSRLNPPIYKVKIGNTRKTIKCAADRSILQAAIAAGVDYPYGCASGNCGVCVSHLDSGEVNVLPHNDTSLSPGQVAAGQTLACRAQPRSDVTITWLGRPRSS